MNHHDRAIAAMRGDPVDRIPFIGRMDLWYSFHRNRGTLPDPYQKADLWDIQRDLDIGIFGFGAWQDKYFHLEYHDVEVLVREKGNKTVTEYHTPFGELRCQDVMAEELHGAAGTSARVEYPFKGEKDYDALQYLFEHTEIVGNLDEYGKFVNQIGKDGLALPFVGHLPAHELMIFWMGYENFYYEMVDHPRQLENLIAALTEQYMTVLTLALDCPVEAVEVGANYDEQMTPPPIFETYFRPLYQEAREILGKHDKIMVVHGDGDMDQLLTSLMECGVQVVEAITPQPMTSIDISKTRDLWSGQITMWGGLASVILTDVFSDEAFEQYLEDLFEAVAPGDHFILGFGDNVPTDAIFERVKFVAAFWRENGTYPICI